MLATQTTPDYARGRWYSNLDWQDHGDLAPDLGYALVVVGEIISPLTVVEETGTLEHGCLRADGPTLLSDVRIFVPEGEGA